jgi:hypothetical protein
LTLKISLINYETPSTTTVAYLLISSQRKHLGFTPVKNQPPIATCGSSVPTSLVIGFKSLAIAQFQHITVIFDEKLATQTKHKQFG